MSIASTRPADAETVRWMRAMVALAACLVLGACQTMSTRPSTTQPVQLVQAGQELPEERLLDVGIEIFAPGEVSAESFEEQESLAEIRKAEARFIPVHLKNTMQRSGHWGLVRVVPQSIDAYEVLVRGEIVDSDGEHLLLRVDAFDATGRQWFSKFYEGHVSAQAYRRTQRASKDAFQSVYNTIANDLATYKRGMPPLALRETRRVAELRFASDLAQDAFGDHLAVGVPSPEGFRRVARLPAESDPMLERVRRIREREYMLIDALDGHYDNLYDQMWDPYGNWRRFRGEEAQSMREVEREAMNQKLLGIASVIGGIAMVVLDGNSSSVNVGGLGTAMAVGGTLYAKKGFDRASEVEMHQEAIRELGVSFESDVKPLVIEVDGETVELTGTASAQFAEWRALLKEIYASETGTLPSLESQSPAYVDDDAPGSAPRALPVSAEPAACGRADAPSC